MTSLESGMNNDCVYSPMPWRKSAGSICGEYTSNSPSSSIVAKKTEDLPFVSSWLASCLWKRTQVCGSSDGISTLAIGADVSSVQAHSDSICAPLSSMPTVARIEASSHMCIAVAPAACGLKSVLTGVPVDVSHTTTMHSSEPVSAVATHLRSLLAVTDVI